MNGFNEGITSATRALRVLAAEIEGRDRQGASTLRQAVQVIDMLKRPEPSEPSEADWCPRIGDEVEPTESFLEKYPEWRGTRMWVVGTEARRGMQGINVTVAEEWPLQRRGDGFTDGFYINQPHECDDLQPARAAIAATGGE